MKLAIAIWVQDIEDWVLNQCIKSLEKQTRKVDEIILAIQPNKEITEFSRISNIAIKDTKADYIGFIGGDTIFSKDSMEIIEKYLKKEPNSVLTCAREDLTSESDNSKIDFVEEFDKWYKEANHAGPILIMAPTKWYKEVGGFDERYLGWGCFDSDIVKRAIKDGLKQVWVNERGVKMIHIWHPTRKSKNPEIVKRNESIYAKGKEVKVNKGKEWGKAW